MILDGRRIGDGARLDCDVCVVGAGIAGLAVAQALDEAGIDTVLVESGGAGSGTGGDALDAGTSTDAAYPFRTSRARGIGGTSSLWYGACVPLDPADFEARDWVPRSGWPIEPATLAPHMEAARALFGLPPGDPLAEDLARSPFVTEDTTAKTVLRGAPLDLGPRHRRRLEHSARVRCVVHATAVELVPDALVTRVERVRLRAGGTGFVVGARLVVLAAGGIENPRLMLASNRVAPGGLGNGRDVLGRHHMEHPIRVVGVLALGDLAAAARLFTDHARRGDWTMQGTLGLSAAARARERLLDMHLRFYRYSALEDTPAVIEGKALARAGPGAALRYLARRRGELVPVLAPYLGWHLGGKLFPRTGFDHVRLMAFVEQEPDPENRIVLGAGRDRYDTPLPHLRTRESASMHDSVRRSMAVLGAALARRGAGQLRSGEEVAHLRAYDKHGLHPMGGTRMAADPRLGVVDADCRVHGLANLFVAGSSVFPTGGAANPTWTIAALALRLGAHLRRVLPEH